MKIAVGCDHVGYELKKLLISHLEAKGICCVDFGTNNSERTDYPVYGEYVARAVSSGECDAGLLICGTGIGMSIVANKVNGIRAVVCSEPYSALLSKRHNNTNVLSIGARVVGSDLAMMILDVWLDGKYEGERHQKRLDMITKIEI